MDLLQVLTVFGVITINLGTVITLYCQMDNKLEAHRSQTTEILLGIQNEIKDFHTRLALQDQEFKMRLCAIEEKSKNQLIR